MFNKTRCSKQKLKLKQKFNEKKFEQKCKQKFNKTSCSKQKLKQKLKFNEKKLEQHFKQKFNKTSCSKQKQKQKLKKIMGGFWGGGIGGVRGF